MNNVLQMAAMASAKIATAQASVTHNLANAGTTAFKADLFYAEQGTMRRRVSPAPHRLICAPET